MNLLAVDSATSVCSVALMQKGRITSEFWADPGQTHSRHMMKQINAVLESAKLQPPDLDAVAVTSGPGSFTGLRISMSVVKGFAQALGLPVCPVSTLKALAWPYLGIPGLFCSMIDARKKQVYYQIFRLNNNGIQEVSRACVASPEDAIDSVCKINESLWFAGSGAVLYRQMIAERLSDRAHMAAGVQNNIRAACVAEMAHEMFNQGLAENAFEAVPIYIRKSDAEQKNCNKS
jgi:tRNA threonylcarbamoyladenosine biosynthesis protein TsaB